MIQDTLAKKQKLKIKYEKVFYIYFYIFSLQHLVSKNQDIAFAYKFSGTMASIAWVIPYLSNNFDTNGNEIINKWLEALPSDRKKFVNDFGFGGSQACYYANSVNINQMAFIVGK